MHEHLLTAGTSIVAGCDFSMAAKRAMQHCAVTALIKAACPGTGPLALEMALFPGSAAAVFDQGHPYGA